MSGNRGEPTDVDGDAVSARRRTLSADHRKKLLQYKELDSKLRGGTAYSKILVGSHSSIDQPWQT